ncbi:hypothetical protein BH11MYX3_BH11MYX3_20000 [soil metagenome]
MPHCRGWTVTGMGPARKVLYDKGMSPVMAARWAPVCALVASLVGAVPAMAERRPVAVVNLDLADDSKARELADQLILALNAHPDLKSLENPTDSAALKDRINDPDRNGLDAARAANARADDKLIEFNFSLAAQYAADGETELLTVSPLAAHTLYADLAFIQGQALLADGRADEAKSAFLQCARLDPDRKLDTARILPKVVEAYAKAQAIQGAPGSITVEGNGRVWIDGIEVGQAPGGFSAREGRHVVWLTGSERNAGGAQAVVTAGQASKVTIADETGGRGLTVQRARVALARAADATAKAAAMNALAKLVRAQDAVLLQVAGEKIIVQTWRAGNVDRSPGFSALRERSREKPVELLTPLAAPKKLEKPIEGPIEGPKPIVAKKWYQRRRVQLGVVAGVVAAVVGGYLLSVAGADSFNIKTDLGIDRPTTVRN